MSSAIQVEKLAKRYQIGRSNESLREHLANLMTWGGSRNKTQEDRILWALRNVSLSIQEGETVGIVGRNGAGKSTLLKILSKITYPTSGTVKVNGRVASLLEVGTGFHEELTGRENVYLNGSILGMSRKQVQRQFDTIVEYSGVERFIDTPIKRYSSGMRLRLGFAVAAHLDPDILIVDEVLSVGDAAFQRKCLDTIEGLRAKARTILFVSHNLMAVENLCERSIWIDRGEVCMDGKSPTVIREYMGTVRDSHTVLPAALDGIENRAGNGKIQFTRVEFLSPEGVVQKVIRSGDSVVVRLYYCAHERITFPCFGFRMYTEYETMVTEVGTSHHGIYISSVEPGEGYVDLEIYGLNLMAAKYLLSLWLTDMPGLVVYDNIENAVTLEVEGANLFQSGKAMDGRQGIVFFPQKWHLEGMSGQVQYTPSTSTDSKAFPTQAPSAPVQHTTR
jgi:homopolymeric O-antigen transport system ATP-binding protein